MKENSLFVLLLTMQVGNAQFPESFDSIITREEKAGNFSGTVLVARNDSILYTRAAGFADAEMNVVNSIQTRFNIASVGKLFTRIIILQLVAEGKLKLEDRISQFFNVFATKGMDQITIFHLLEHKSGLRDVLVSKEYLKGLFRFPAKVLEQIAEEKLAFAPGTGDQYSNSGYYVLGALISHLTRMSLSSAMAQRIFEPLVMTNTGFANSGDPVQGHASSYKKKRNSVKKTTQDNSGEPPTGSGSQYSTAGDLFKLFRSIIDDSRLLDENSKSLLFNHFQPGNWKKMLYTGKITGYVGGDTRGWSAKLSFMFYPKYTYGVIILSNFDNMAHELDLKLRPLINK